MEMLSGVARSSRRLLRVFLLLIPTTAHAQTAKLVFPQVADGGSIRFELVLTNPTGAKDAGTIHFLDGKGQPLLITLSGKQQASVSYSIPPKGAFKIQSDGIGAVKTGYAIVVPDGTTSQLTGAVIYNLNEFEVSVPNSPLSTRYHVFVERTPSANSGIAFANPGSKDLTISLIALDQGGVKIAETKNSLPAGHQLPRFVNEIFTQVASTFKGTVHAYSDQPFAMVGFRQSRSGSLAILSGAPTAAPEEGVLVGTAGGRVQALSGVVQLDIPSGAVSEEVVITVEKLKTPETMPTVLPAEVRAIERLNLQPQGLTFDKRVKVRLDLTRIANVPPTDRLAVLLWSDKLTLPEILPITTIEQTAKTVEFEITHFSVLDLVEWLWPGPGNSWRVYRSHWVIPAIRWYLERTSRFTYLDPDVVQEALNRWSSYTSSFIFQRTLDRSQAQIIFREVGTTKFLEVETFDCAFGIFGSWFGSTCFDFSATIFEDTLEEDDSVLIRIASDAIKQSTTSGNEANAMAFHTILHEVGHTIGIAHPRVSPGSNSVMAAPPPILGQLGAWDIEALYFHYALPKLSIDDNFDDNSLDPKLWSSLGLPPGFSGTVAETSQRLEITVGPGFGGTGIVSRCSLSGNFDVQVDYLLLNWPPINLHSVRLGAADFGVGQFGGIGLNRSSFPNSIVGSSEFYLLALPDSKPQTATTHTSGKLRLVRSGSTLSGYFHSGASWVVVGSGQVSTSPTRFYLDLGGGDSAAPGGVKIAFDNFKVNAGSVQCPTN